MINNRKIIVTGCAGFVGSNLVDKLIQNDVSVLGIDNLVTGQKRFLNSALQNKNFLGQNMSCIIYCQSFL